MVTNPVALPGWSVCSRWGSDRMRGFYAQLTRDENAAADRPDVWLVPPKTEPMATREQLAEAIAREAGVTIAEALSALAA